MKQQKGPNHYNESYDSKERFCSYWHQINEIVSHKPRSVLEVGIGNGLVANYLKQLGTNIITLDIDRRLNPDCIGSVSNIPFTKNNFELVACFEALEHLPFEEFSKALKEIHRVTYKFAILSLPDCTRAYQLYLHIPKTKINSLKKLIPIPRWMSFKDIFHDDHYWEIGYYTYPLSKIITNIESVGFNIYKTYRVFEYPYHRFFILNKMQNKNYD